MNSLIHMDSCCPRSVFQDRELTKLAGPKALLGWMLMGDKPESMFRPKPWMSWLPVGLNGKVDIWTPKATA